MEWQPKSFSPLKSSGKPTFDVLGTPDPNVIFGEPTTGNEPKADWMPKSFEPSAPYSPQETNVYAAKKAMQLTRTEKLQALGEAMKQTAGQDIGGTVGGIVGGMTGGLPGALIGAGLLGGAGQVTQDVIQTGEPNAANAGRAALIQPAGELGGRALVRGGKALGRALILKQPVELAGEMAQEFAKVGGTLLPSQVDKRATQKIAEKMARSSWFGGHLFKKFDVEQVEKLKTYADMVADSIDSAVGSLPPEELGKQFAASISTGRQPGMLLEMKRMAADAFYDEYTKLSANKPIASTRDITDYAKATLKQDDKLKGTLLSPKGRTELEKAAELNPVYSVEEIRTIHTAHEKLARSFGRDLDQSDTYIRELANKSKDAIFKADTSPFLSPEAKAALTRANAQYRALMTFVDRVFPETLADRVIHNPSEAVKAIIPDRNPTAIRNIKTALTKSPEAWVDAIEPGISAGRQVVANPTGEVMWQRLKGAWLANAIDESSKDGMFSHATFANRLKKLGEASANELFTPEEWKNVQKIRDLSGLIENSKRFTLENLTAHFLQVKGAYGLYQGASNGDTVGILGNGALFFGPSAMARAILNPKTARWLVMGLKSPGILKPGGGELGALGGRIAKVLYHEDKIEDQKRQAKLREYQKREREAKWRKSQQSVDFSQWRGGPRGL